MKGFITCENTLLKEQFASDRAPCWLQRKSLQVFSATPNQPFVRHLWAHELTFSKKKKSWMALFGPGVEPCRFFSRPRNKLSSSLKWKKKILPNQRSIHWISKWHTAPLTNQHISKQQTDPENLLYSTYKYYVIRINTIASNHPEKAYYKDTCTNIDIEGSDKHLNYALLKRNCKCLKNVIGLKQDFSSLYSW